MALCWQKWNSWKSVGVCFHRELQETVGEKLSLMVRAVRQMAKSNKEYRHLNSYWSPWQAVAYISSGGWSCIFFCLLGLTYHSSKACLFSQRIKKWCVFKSCGQTGQQHRKESPGEDVKKLAAILDYPTSRWVVLNAQPFRPAVSLDGGWQWMLEHMQWCLTACWWQLCQWCNRYTQEIN